MNARFSGRKLPDSPDISEIYAQFEAETLTAVQSASDPEIAPAFVRPYQQQDATTCFYASLLAIKKALPGDAPETENSIANEARANGLLGWHGAETGPERYEEQRKLVRNHLGLEIRFVKERTFGIGQSFVNALDQGKHVVLGMPIHWVVINGLKSNERKWKGMDPAPGKRVDYDDATIHGRLISHGLPLVIVEGIATPKFHGVETRPKFKPRNSKFNPAKSNF